MKPGDWNGHKIPLLAHAFSLARGLSADVHIRAASRDEALIEVWKKLQRNQVFLRKTGGEYDVQFFREAQEYKAA